jgi:hypothetical protein
VFPDRPIAFDSRRTLDGVRRFCQAVKCRPRVYFQHVEHLSRDQIILAARDAVEREPIFAACRGCGEQRELDWDMELVCPGCGQQETLAVRVVRSSGAQRWESVDLDGWEVVAFGDSADGVCVRTIAELPRAGGVVVLHRTSGVSAQAYPADR